MKYEVKLDVKQDIKTEWPDVKYYQPAGDHAVKREPLVKSECKQEEIKVKREHTLADAITDLATLLGQSSPVRGAKPGLDAAASPDSEVMFVPESNVAVAAPVQEDVKPKLEAVVDIESTPVPDQVKEAVKRARLLQKLQQRKSVKQEARK